MTDKSVNQNSEKPKLPSKKAGFANKLKGFFIEEVETDSLSSEEKVNSIETIKKIPQEPIQVVKSVETLNPVVSNTSVTSGNSVEIYNSNETVKAVETLNPEISKTSIPTKIPNNEMQKPVETVEPVDFVDIPKVVKEPVLSDSENEEMSHLKETLKSKEFVSEVEELNNMTFGKGINLIITKTEEEIVVEEKKFKLNLTSVFALVIFVTVTILVFGVNIAYKLTYNIQANKVEELKETFSQDYYLVTANNKILDRLMFMRGLNETNYSPKQVLNFLNDLTKEYGKILSFTITTDLEFTLVGSTSSYASASKLWHLMIVNKDIEYVTIRSISKANDTSVFITFEGQLNYNSFVKLLENKDELTKQ